MNTLIKIGGIYNILLIIFHLLFWKIFSWDSDLRKLTFLNRAIMQVLNISLCFAFLTFSYISLAHTNELLNTALGHSLLVLIALFWFARTLQQVIFFKLRHWISVAFLLFFFLGCLLYAIPAFMVLS